MKGLLERSPKTQGKNQETRSPRLSQASRNAATFRS